MENTMISTKEKRSIAVKVANECLDKALNNMCGLKQNEYNLIKDLLETLDCEVERLSNNKPQVKFQDILRSNPISSQTMVLDTDKKIKDYLRNTLSFDGNKFSYRKYKQGLQELFEAIEDMVSSYILSCITNGSYNPECFEIKYGEYGDQNNFTTFNDNGETYLVCTQPKWYTIENIERDILELLTDKITVNRFCENIVNKIKEQVKSANNDIMSITCTDKRKLRVFIDAVRMRENIDYVPEEITYALMIKIGILKA